MSNLTRYDFELSYDYDWGHKAVAKKSTDGEFVKFDDIKEFLKPSHNSGSPKCMRCGKPMVYQCNNIPCLMAELDEQTKRSA